MVGLRYYEQSQLGFVQFNVGTMTNDRPVVADVLNSRGELLQTISLPMRESAAIPSGAYHVRLSAPGRLSESYAFEVTAGERNNYDVSLADAPLWKPLVLSSPDACGFTNSDGETSIVVGPQDEALPIAACYSGRATELSNHDRAAGGPALRWKADWSADSPRLTSLLKNDEQRVAWKQFVAAWSQTGYEPQLIQSSLDIDQDGTGDLIWWYASGVVAASGKDGTPLFLHRPANSSGESGQLAAPPIIFSPKVSENDKPDQEPTLVFLCVTAGSTWLEAVSTRIATPHVGNLAVRWRRTVEREKSSGSESFSDCSLSICRSGGQLVAGCVSGHWLSGFFLQSGEPAWPSFDLTIRSTLPAAFVDFNGDGQDEVLLVQPEGAFGVYLIRVITLESPPRELWRTTVTRENSPLPFTPIRPSRIRITEGIVTSLGSLRDAVETAAWPVLADLDNDKQLEIVVPARRLSSQNGSNGIVIREGMTGKVRWERHWPLHSLQSGMGYFHPVQDAYAIGPDLNGDGVQEFYIASIYDEQHREDLSKSGLKYHFHGEDFLYVDCLSGRDGQNLWWTRERLGESSGSLGGADWLTIGWWEVYGDESPQLVVPVIRHNDTIVERTFAVSAATGRIARVMRESARPVIGDFDSDGLPDLVTFQPDDPKAFELFSTRTEDRRGRLRVIRGTPSVPYRRLGQWVAAADFDGDGHSELIRKDEPVRNRILSVASGADGAIAFSTLASGLESWH